MRMSDYKEELLRGFVVHEVPLTLEELEFLEFLLILYGATEEMKSFQETLQHRLKKYREEATEYVCDKVTKLEWWGYEKNVKT